MLKQHLAQLLGRIDVKALSRQLINQALVLGDSLVQHLPVFLQGLDIHLHAADFHRCQHLGQRQLNLVQELFLTALCNQLPQRFVQRQQVHAVLHQLFVFLLQRLCALCCASGVVARTQSLDGIFRAVDRQQIGRQQQVVLNIPKGTAAADGPMIQALAVKGQLGIRGFQQLYQILNKQIPLLHLLEQNLSARTDCQIFQPFAVLLVPQRCQADWLLLVQSFQ